MVTVRIWSKHDYDRCGLRSPYLVLRSEFELEQEDQVSSWLK